MEDVLILYNPKYQSIMEVELSDLSELVWTLIEDGWNIVGTL